MAKTLGTPIEENSGPKKFTPSFAQKDRAFGDPWVEVQQPFMLKFHPTRWAVMAGRLVPMLSSTTMVAGVNGTIIRKGGDIAFNRTKAKFEDAGWVFIPYTWGPDGESYIQVVQTRPGGRGDLQDTYLMFSASVHAGDRRVEADGEAYAEWLESLVGTKLPKCPPVVIERMIEKAEAYAVSAEAEAASGKPGSGKAGVVAKSHRETIAVLEAALKAQKPKRVRSRKATPKIETEGGE